MKLFAAALLVAALGCAREPDNQPATTATASSSAPKTRVPDDQVATAYWDIGCDPGSDKDAKVAEFQVPCGGGKDFVLVAAEKELRCQLKTEGEKVVGGLCVVEDAPGEVRVASKVDCARGCVCASGAGNCIPQ